MRISIGTIQNKIKEAKNKFNLDRQNKAEIKAKNLEEKAIYFNKLGDTLQRQEKAKVIIERTKDLQRKQRTEKINKVLSGIKKVKKNVENLEGKQKKKKSVYDFKPKNVFGGGF